MTSMYLNKIHSRIKHHPYCVRRTWNEQDEKADGTHPFAEPGEGQLASVHAKCPEGLPGERADKVFSLRQQHFYQGAGFCVLQPSEAHFARLAVPAASNITKFVRSANECFWDAYRLWNLITAWVQIVGAAHLFRRGGEERRFSCGSERVN